MAKGVEPEKGHLVPRSRLTEVFGVDILPTGTHEINSVGNLTYMSRARNRALGSDFLDLGAERAGDPENLSRHFIGSSGSNDIGALYESIRKQLRPPAGDSDPDERGIDAERVKREFLRLTKARRQPIKESFEQWLRDLSASAASRLGLPALDHLGIWPTETTALSRSLLSLDRIPM